jgi:hypothetical protein
MKSKLFNVVVYAMLTYSIVNAGYLALPVEMQEMIPQYNSLVAIISGGASGIIGFGGLKLQDYLNRAKVQSDDKFNLLAQNYLNLERKYDLLDNAYKTLKTAQDNTTKAVERNNKLLEVDLQTKLSNPLIEEAAKKLIEDVLHND